MTTARPVQWGPRASPAAVPRVAWGEGGPANDPQLGPTLWGATTSARHPPAGMPPGDGPLFWRWIRWIFIGSAPGASDSAGAPLLVSKAVGKPPGLRPWTRGSWRRWAVRTGQRPGAHCRPPDWHVCKRRCRASGGTHRDYPVSLD